MKATEQLKPSRQWTLASHLTTLSVLTILAAAPRLYNLTTPGLWGDELATIRGALDLFSDDPQYFYSKVLGYVPTAVGLWAQDLVPPTIQPNAITEWRSKGLDEYPARLPSCLVGIATIALLFLVTRRIVSTPAAALACVFLALSHWHILWSQSARFYSLQFAFYSLSLVLYYRTTQSQRKIHWAASLLLMLLVILLMLLAILSQPTAAVLVLVFLAHVIFRRVTGDLPRLGKIPVTITLVIGAMLLSIAVRDIVKNPDAWLHFFQSANHPPFRHILAVSFYVQPPMILVGLATAFWLYRRKEGLGVFLLLAGALPPVAFAVVGLYGYVEPRYSFVCLYPWLLLAAVGCIELARSVKPWSKNVLVLLPMLALLTCELVCLFGYFTEGGYRSRVREAMQYVAAHMQPGDLICAEPQEGAYYLGRPIDINIWTEKRKLYELTQRTWIVCGASNHGFPARSWLERDADLKATFDTYLVGPSEMVHVYLYDPHQTEYEVARDSSGKH